MDGALATATIALDEDVDFFLRNLQALPERFNLLVELLNVSVSSIFLVGPELQKLLGPVHKTNFGLHSLHALDLRSLLIVLSLPCFVDGHDRRQQIRVASKGPGGLFHR